MSKLEIITLGRDDDYGGEFIQRLHDSIAYNMINVKDTNIDWSYLIVDWFPHDNRYLYKNGRLSSLFTRSNIQSLIVDKSIAEPESLSGDSFYELFAKNAGVRHTDAEWILILNADIIVPKQMWKEIQDIIDTDKGLINFYRARYRTEMMLGEDPERSLLKPPASHTNNFLGHVVDMRKKSNPDDHVGGPFGGDLIMMRKDVFSKYGRAYDETNTGHRSKTLRQATMDSEILLNLDFHGAKMVQFETPYIHIFHGHPFNAHRTSAHHNPNGYENKEDWGFIKYNKELAFNGREDISIIYHGELP